MKNNNLLEELKKEKYIAQFIAKNKLGDEYLSQHLSPFIDSYESIRKCNQCQGLFTCTQKKQGEIITLKNDEGVYNEITYCKFYLEKLRMNKQVNNFIKSDIPKEYALLDLDNIDIPDENIEDLCALMYEIYDEKRTKGLYIYGDLGVGKTYICIALANSLNKSGKKVSFVKSNYFINEMRKLVSINNIEYEQLLDKVKRSEYLFIDDIGSESVSSYSRDDLLFNILDYRMENKLMTIFTSNLSKDSLLKHYTYDKNDNSSIMRARRLLERIDILSEDFVLKGKNKRRIK